MQTATGVIFISVSSPYRFGFGFGKDLFRFSSSLAKSIEQYLKKNNV